MSRATACHGRLAIVTDLQQRSKAFALRVIRACQALPRTTEARTIGAQLLRSGTSVAANYRAACRARSRREFISKIGIVVEETDETAFWLELIVDAGLVPANRLPPLRQEATELLAIFAASYHTARRRRESSQAPETPPPMT